MTLTLEQLAGLSVIRKERGDPNKRGRGSKNLKGDTMGGKFDISSKSIKALMTTVERAIIKVTLSKDDESGAMEEGPIQVMTTMARLPRSRRLLPRIVARHQHTSATRLRTSEHCIWRRPERGRY